MRPITEEETYRRLKHKVDYAEACTIYTMAAIGLGSDAPREHINALAEPELAKVGWTLDELYEESILQEALHRYDSRYG